MREERPFYATCNRVANSPANSRRIDLARGEAVALVGPDGVFAGGEALGVGLMNALLLGQSGVRICR
jgi:hypothetical protein